MQYSFGGSLFHAIMNSRYDATKDTFFSLYDRNYGPSCKINMNRISRTCVSHSKSRTYAFSYLSHLISAGIVFYCRCAKNGKIVKIRNVYSEIMMKHFMLW